jgi:tryptophan synthase alpha chain
MNRIDACFERLGREGRKGFIAYIGAGDPDLEATIDLSLGLDHAGVDLLELGIPFSDPLADGLVNQLAAQRGLASGTTPPKVFKTVAAIREQSQIPIVLYVYFNLMHKAGLENFIREAARSGVDGLLALDLPPEEAGNYEEQMGAAGLRHIYLVAPTTPDERIREIARRASGFIYYVSREGVTGMQQSLSESIGRMTAKIREATSLPIAIGFGISTPEQARTAAACGDAIVVGSAIVDQIARHGKSPRLVHEVRAFVEPLIQALREPVAT